MIPLIAAASASIFESDELKVSLVVLMVLAIAYALSLLRDLRKNVTSEVRMQLAADEAEGKAQEIPQPLVTKKHVDFTPYSEHRELKSEFEKLREQRRIDVGGLHQKIEQGMKDTREDIAATAVKVAQLQTTTDNQSNDISAIKEDLKKVDDRIDEIPRRTISLLRETKGLI